MAIGIDYGNMLAPRVAGAIGEDAWRSAHDAFAAAVRTVDGQRAAGSLGFLDLAAGHTGLDALRRFADGAGQAFSDIVVLGIGGSALGPIALRTALRPPAWNASSDEARDFFPRLHVLDNIDPVTVGHVLANLEVGRTLFIVISKSGGTAETMAQYLIVRERLVDALGDAFRRHLVFITDPEHGALRTIARAERIVSLDIPPNVGGRFSVLSPVGLLPAALIGIDIDALLAGAADMAARCLGAPLDRNPAGIFGTLQWVADTQLGLGIQVMMPYCDALRDMGAWFAQLWAESLGKLRDGDVPSGPTPLTALGATDQHSQLQLFMEGPRNKTITFIAVADRGGPAADLVIPRLHADVPELAYLGGHTLGELIDVERRATAGALARHGRPSLTITLDRVDSWHVGGLILMLELATVYSGALYHVNPLDQPGVELGKRYTYGMLGRADAEAARREWESLPAADARWIV